MHQQIFLIVKYNRSPFNKIYAGTANGFFSIGCHKIYINEQLTLQARHLISMKRCSPKFFFFFFFHYIVDFRISLSIKIDYICFSLTRLIFLVCLSLHVERSQIFYCNIVTISPQDRHNGIARYVYFLK